MELEQRVKVLEQEVKILKNQIQATLLDIQEHVLTAKYPSLRADDVSYKEAAAAIPPHTAPLSGNGKPAEIAMEASAPIVRKVSLADLEERQSLNDDLTEEDALPPATTQTDWDALNQLTEWAISNIEKLGVERTRKLIDIYAQQGLLAPEVKDALAQIAGVFDERDFYTAGDDTQAAGDTEQAGYEYEEAETSPKSHQRNLILKLIDHLQRSGAGREASRG